MSLLPVCLGILKIIKRQNLYPFVMLFLFKSYQKLTIFFSEPFTSPEEYAGFWSWLCKYFKFLYKKFGLHTVEERESCSCHAACSVYKNIFTLHTRIYVYCGISLRTILGCGIGQVLEEKSLWSIRYLWLKWLLLWKELSRNFNAGVVFLKICQIQ